ncbi:hypothetical protein VRY85_11040 [Achromobacter sp. F4_2707]|uniref:hypothetical protein n=1 Tax=Achromobacter sp. F4_2707 TaxID=3114286 RepID=UPI0039C60F71
MQVTSHVVNRFDTGVVLDVNADGLPVRAYVAISAPDPEAVTAFVPPEQFESGSSLHVAAISTADEASATLEDVLFNMEADDAVAFLCADPESWLATLEQLGCDPDSDSSPLE